MTRVTPLILLIEDEPQIRRFLRTTLASEGFRVVEAANGRDALAQAGASPPDLILLDLGLPDRDGLVVLRNLREWTKVPVIIISARGQEDEKVAGLDAGADDYLAKPFGVGELMARIRAAMRRANRADGVAGEEVVICDDLKVDLGRRLVFLRGQEVNLTPTEYRLLSELVKHADRVLTNRHLLKEVWGPHCIEDNQYLRIYIHQLRHKLEADPARPKHFVTETGVGYRFRSEAP
jgi:two-component system, OmpR family, KDP operon response regulator KdpE